MDGWMHCDSPLASRSSLRILEDSVSEGRWVQIISIANIAPPLPLLSHMDTTKLASDM